MDASTEKDTPPPPSFPHVIPSEVEERATIFTTERERAGASSEVKLRELAGERFRLG